jgi:RNA polymerase sigma factor (sigma-70 family)
MSVTQQDLSTSDPWDDDPEAAWAEAFHEICGRHRGRLIRWLTAIFGARDAEDIAQEALVRLYVRPGTVDEPADAWPWLAVVARNVGRDMARHNAQSTTVDNDHLAALPANVAVLDQVIARDDADRLARALRALTPRERAVIRLRDFEGTGITEIAELLGTNENAVRQQLFRARRRLASAYLALGGDRGAGLVAVLGLRVRALVRRYGQFLGDLSTNGAAALGAALPSLAVVGGTLFVGTPTIAAAPPRWPAHAGADVAGRDAAAHGTAGTGGGAHLRAATPAHRAGRGGTRPDPDPYHEEHRRVGPAKVDLYQYPYGYEAGPADEMQVWVYGPNGERYGFEEYGYKNEGDLLICKVPWPRSPCQ